MTLDSQKIKNLIIFSKYKTQYFFNQFYLTCLNNSHKQSYK